ncbi:MAG: hypothetical protein RI922_1064 [Bacteroidota bacterium]|jgi:hypothetical protein
MKKVITSCLLLTLLVACTGEMSGISKPNDVIPRDTMVMILKDMSLLESHIQAKYIHVSRFQETMKRSGKKLLDGYHVSHDRFNRSMDYYGSRQEEMQSIYAEILDSLNREAIIVGKNVNIDSSNFELQRSGISVKKIVVHQ